MMRFWRDGPLGGLILAFQFLTRLPMPAVERVEARDLAHSSVYFPLVGIVIGLILSGLMWALLPRGPWLAAAAVLIGWVWVTGALHLDGLGDVADALGAAHRKPERFFEVLEDPHAGNFAVVTICLQLVAKLVLVAHIPAAAWYWSLVLIPAWARWGTLVWSAALPPLKRGLGQDFSSGNSKVGIALWALALSVASIILAPALLAALLLVPAIAFYWRRRLGGVSGDCLGASVEVAETILLACVVVGLM
ncbi:MAG: adenosylcobinamide-GDP ribazoletransferase [Hyphomicrobium sp.]